MSECAWTLLAATVGIIASAYSITLSYRAKRVYDRLSAELRAELIALRDRRRANDEG
jgi:hypothetical protein